MRPRLPRAVLAVLAIVATTGLVTGCGGDDEPASREVATVTDGVQAPTGAEFEEAVRIYVEVFGFTEDQARCVLTKAAELSGGGAAADLAAADPATGGRILRECGIDPADVSSQLTP